MIFSLAIYGAPYNHSSADSAYQFTVAALASGHSIYRLFFYSDGVHNASTLITPPQDELQLNERWNELIRCYNLDAVVCIAAALRRGILDTKEADRYDKNCSNLSDQFELSGLGQMIDACKNSDQILTFG